MIREIFTDRNGKLSSKRVMGALLILTGVVYNGIGLGDPATNQVMIWSGIAALGVGTLETKVAK